MKADWTFDSHSSAKLASDSKNWSNQFLLEITRGTSGDITTYSANGVPFLYVRRGSPNPSYAVRKPNGLELMERLATCEWMANASYECFKIDEKEKNGVDLVVRFLTRVDYDGCSDGILFVWLDGDREDVPVMNKFTPKHLVGKTISIDR